MMKTTIILICGMLFSTTAIMAQVNIDPDNALIQYWGRIDFSNPKAPAFEYPGVTIKAKFTGTAISMKLHDYAAHASTTTNYFYKIIDGGEPEKFEAKSGTNTYPLASGLSAGSHTIEIIKLTEALVGKSAFQGFVLETGHSLEEITDTPSQTIEFIGNSITCGYGNESNLPDPSTSPGFHSINENNYKAWGYVAARKLGMAYRAVAYSGRGMYRNNDGSTNGIMPQIYDRVFPDNVNSPTWDHADNHPDFIVINLGTNDFAQDPSTPLDESLYKSTYVSFVEYLKTLHPNATVICATGVMMSNGYPTGANHWTRITTYVQEVVETLTDSGQDDIYYFQMNPQSAPYGEDWHPTIATHLTMATQLTDFIYEITGTEPPKVTDIDLAQSSIAIYPNPATDTLIFKGKENVTYTLRIYDMDGKEVMKAKVKDHSMISLQKLSAGTYIVQTTDGKESVRRKIVKK